MCLLVLLGFPITGVCGSSLPPIDQDETKLSGVSKVFVRQLMVDGNTVYSDQELFPLLFPYQNREITAEELQEAKNQVTRHYISNGYINSGALIPDQEVKNGIIRMRVIEGRLTDTSITGNSWLRTSYISDRLALVSESENGVLNINRMQEGLKLLKQNPLIENVNAELRPGLQRGEASLNVDITESRPYYLSLRFNNYNSPGIGAYRGEIEGGLLNLTGWGDSLRGQYALTEGLDEYWISYTVPLNRWDTTLSLEMERSETEVVAAPFEELRIESETTTYTGFLRHPFYKSLSSEFALGLKLEKSTSDTYLLGERFAFTGDPSGTNKQTAIRFTQEWVSRSLKQVMAAYSSINFGVDLFDATVLETDPDGKFLSWLGQFQWIRRLDWLESQVFYRLYVQVANNPLLPVEKFAIGGSSTVRGYRENQMTTDSGMVTSLEWRIPVVHLPVPGISKGSGDGILELAPFFDLGHGWNDRGTDPSPDTIYSLGLGARWLVSPLLRAEIYWGHALESVPDVEEYDLQDDGIHFEIVANIF